MTYLTVEEAQEYTARLKVRHESQLDQIRETFASLLNQ